MADKRIADAQTGATQAKEHALVAKDRIERLKKGEAVAGGLGKPMTREDLWKMIGWTAIDQRHANRLSLIHKVPRGYRELIGKYFKGRDRREKTASLRILKRLAEAGELDHLWMPAEREDEAGSSAYPGCAAATERPSTDGWTWFQV